MNYYSSELMKVLRMDYDLIAYNIDKILYFMKNEEKVFFKVKIMEKIKHFFQLKKHIVVIVSEENIYFYKLMQLEPYIVPINVFIPKIEKNNIVQIYGNIYQNLYILKNDKYIYKLVQKKENIPNYDICLKIEYSIQIKDNLINNIIPIYIPTLSINSIEHNDSGSENNNINFSNQINNENNTNSNQNGDNSYNEDNSNNSGNSNRNNNNNLSNNDNNNNIFNNHILKESQISGNKNIGDDTNSINKKSQLSGDNNKSEEKKHQGDNSYIYNEKNSANLDNSKIVINKIIMYEEMENSEKFSEELFLIKGIVFNYLILIENISLTIRNETNLNLIKTIKIRNNDYYLIVYNEHIIRPDENYIKFYSIPDLILVSMIKVSEPINYFLIPNKNIFLVISDNYIEQLELNTWKKISKVIYRDKLLNKKEKNDNDNKSIIVGNNKELYMFQKGEIYRFEERP